MNKRREIKGFTLIELLTVIAIIALLAGILMPVVNTVKRKALETKAKAMIGSISTAIKMYEMDFGDIPPDDNHASSAAFNRATESLYRCLTTQWTTANASIYAGPYMEFKGDVSKNIGVANRDSDSKYEIVDPWGNEYCYESDDDNGAVGNAPYHNRFSFDIFSMGADGTTDTFDGDGTPAATANCGTEAGDINNWD